MKKLLLILFLALSLEACLPAAFVAGAAAGGTVVYDRRSSQTMLDDQNIAYNGQARLDQNEDLKGKTHISAVSFNHSLLLVGQAKTPELRTLAVASMQSLPKIKNIHNEITIGNPISNQQKATDAWITTKVKSVLLASKGLEATQIKVVTENGTVFLMGIVKHRQAQTAIMKIKNLDGINKIVKVFEYTD
jgi:osmotically-inducible protein OsmY